MSIKTSDMFEVRPVAQREWNILILLAFIFWGVVVVTGLVIPLVVGIYSFMVGVPLVITGLVGLLALIGAVYFKYVILRSGFYEKPI